ncbi:efflux RND transporter permease subunit, partial [Thiolapillus sp.]
ETDVAPGDLHPFDAEHDSHGIALRIQEAAREVGRPVFYAVIIIIVVFAPLFALEGVEGKLFQPMAISIVLAMITSLVVALVVMPALATFSFRKAVRHRNSPVFIPIEWLYKRSLRFAMKARWLVVAVALVLFAGAMVLLPKLGTEFVPELEEGTINIRATLAPSASLNTALGVAAELEKQLMQFPEVTYASSRVGRAELGGDPEPVSNVEVYVGLKPVKEWTSAKNRFELQKKFEAALSTHPGLLFTFSQPIATRVDELLSGVKAQLA